MANTAGGPGSYDGIGNTFIGSGGYALVPTGVVLGTAAATAASGNAEVTLGTAGLSLVSTYTLTADVGSSVTIESLLGTSIGNTLDLNANGGTIILGSGLSVSALGATNVTISNGGIFEIGATVTALSGATVNFAASGGTFRVDAVAINALSGISVNGFNTASRIDVAGATSIASVANGTNDTIVTFNNGAQVTLNGVVLTSAQLQGGSDGSGGLVLTTCFLAGTLIATPAGAAAVETLKAGDLVTVLEDGHRVSRPVKWVGSHDMHAADHGHREEAFPVRVRAGAFGENLPERDLLMTAEHCIFVDGRLVPVRMLVNGASILFDRSIPDYSFYHIELDQHGILLAEGLPTESYADTGNRALFGDTHAEIMTQQVALAAPLAVDQATVEPIWARLNARAATLGFAAPTQAGDALSANPQLRVLLDSGEQVAARLHSGLRYLFRIPRGARAIALLSASDTPASVFGAFVDDRRRLGVKVSDIVLHEGASVRPALPHAALPGWHDAEPDGRWTDGRAQLELPEPAREDAYLDVRLAATLRYRRQEPAGVLSLRAA